MVKKGIKQLIDEANAEIETITAAEALAQSTDDNNLIVDLRDIRELYREGRIPGSQHSPRGMLEFWVDPDSPYHKEIFSMGVEKVCHIEGGYTAWKEANGPTEAVEKK